MGIKWGETLAISAITPQELAQCKARVKIGDSFRVADRFWKRDQGAGPRPIKRGRVTGIYRHLVTLDIGESVTFVQIAQYGRRRGADKYID